MAQLAPAVANVNDLLAATHPEAVTRLIVTHAHFPTPRERARLVATRVRELGEAGHPWFAELTKFDRVRLVDLPTGHWPMWSRPDDLADELLDVVVRSSSAV